MTEGFLNKILATKRQEIEKAREILPQDKIVNILQELSPDGNLRHHSAIKRDFRAAISIPQTMSLIAEIKKTSPSKGVLRRNFDPVKIAGEYESAGAAAISVLTDEQFFGGHNNYVGRVKEATHIPVLRKDFIIDEYQIYQSALIEADCALLVADILEQKKIEKFLLTAALVNLDVLVESNTPEALNKAIDSGAKLVGINNRNLNTFEIDIKTTERLIKRVPKGSVVVSESGIRTAGDIRYLKSLGVNAVLIGEPFMQAQDISVKVKEIMGW